MGKIIKEKIKESGEKGLKNIFISRGLSGSLKKLGTEFCKKMNFEYPGSIETIDYNPQKEANRIVFNNKKIPRYGIGDSDVLITIGAEILDTFLSPVEFSKMIREARGKICTNGTTLVKYLLLQDIPRIIICRSDQEVHTTFFHISLRTSEGKTGYREM